MAQAVVDVIFLPLMQLSRWILPIAVFLTSTIAGGAAADPLVLEGEIQRSNTLVHPFEHHGHRLEFRLVPMGHGWAIWINAPADRQRNFVTVATPPFRGINPAVIQGWHFRNVDNSGPNAPGEGNVNAPGRTRNFAFVLDNADYQATREAMEILFWPEGRTKKEIDAAKARTKAIPHANATMEILALELGNLVKGEQAWIERMAFRLTIEMP